MTETELLARWVRASFAVGRIGEDPLGPMLTYEVQSLGRLDVNLRAEDASLEAMLANDTGGPGGDVSDHLGLSRLWVLGGYELVRTLSACVRLGLWVLDERLTASLVDLKHNFSLVRIPLAKFEPAFEKGTAPGDLIAEAGLVPGLGAAWKIEEDVTCTRVIARTELADQLLAFLEEVRKKNPLRPNG